MNVFDIEDFVKARIAEDDRTGGLGARLLEIHHPLLVTWHPSWFCDCCEGDDEPQHHMSFSAWSGDDDGVREDFHDDGPLSKAGADWPCPTVAALADVWSDHPDHGNWIPGVREQASTFGTVYVLKGGPASDGRARLRLSQPAYLDDPAWGPDDSVVQMMFTDPVGMDGKAVLRIGEIPGAYRYRAATDTIEWDGPEDADGPVTGVTYGRLDG